MCLVIEPVREFWTLDHRAMFQSFFVFMLCFHVNKCILFSVSHTLIDRQP